MRWNRTLKRLYIEFGQDQVGTYASSAAFYMFLSFIPILILLCSILPFTPIKEIEVITWIKDILPDYLDAFGASTIREMYGKSLTTISLTALVLLWSAGKGILAIMNGLNTLNHVKEDRNYLIVRMWASLYTLILLVMLLLSMLVVVLGNVFMQIILSKYPDIQPVFRFLMMFRIVFVWCILTVFCILLYRFMPNVKQSWKSQIPGSCFTGVGWSIFSFCFSLYIDHSNSLNMYGSLATIIIILIWTYFCMFILMMGAKINRILLEERRLSKI